MKLMVSGWASELRILGHGRSQIFSFVLSGDVVLTKGPAPSDSCTLVTLTPVTCIDVARLIALAPPADRLDLERVMTRALAITRERRYDLARRLRLKSRLARTADLLIELHDRLASVGLVSGSGFELPLRAEHMADASGLTRPQVQRSLRYLQAKKLAVLRFGHVTRFDEAGLRAIRDR